MARVPGRGPRPSLDLQTLVERGDGFSQEESTGAIDMPGAYASHLEGEEVVEDVSTRDIAAYRRRHHRELTQPGTYFGGYREGDTTYLDQSRRFTGPTRVEEALDWGREQGQVSVYDSVDKKLHYVHTNENVTGDDQYPYSEAMAQGARSQWGARGKPPGPSRTRHVDQMVDSVVQAQRIAHPETEFGPTRSVGDLPETTSMKRKR